MPLKFFGTNSVHSIILSAVLFLFSSIVAAPVNIAMVRAAAETQISIEEEMGANRKYSYSILKIDSLFDSQKSGEKIIGYIVELSPKGYIALSSDSDIRPVIAYSFDNDFDFSSDDGNILSRPGGMLETDLSLRLNAIPLMSRKIKEAHNLLWQRYCSKSSTLFHSLDSIAVYGPWLDTRWGQGNPYNRYCPMDPTTSERSVTGCSNTAMAQIINYWEYPPSVEFFSFESYWSHMTDPPIWIDAPTATIDTIEYNTAYGVQPSSNTIAQIMWACGVSLRASYSSTGTAAGFSASDYTGKWNYIDAANMDGEAPDFYDELQDDMINAKPVQFAIYLSDWTGGHSIVCDGYKESGEFHLNYGWTGSSDGWYFLPDGMPAGYSIISFAIMHITPPPRPDSPDDCAEAVFLNVSDEEKWYSDAISPAGDEDWFSFYATPESAYVFYTVGTYDTYGEIFSSCSSEPIAQDDSSWDDINFEIDFVPETAGIYYLKVNGLSSAPVGNYTLRYYSTQKTYLDVSLPNGGELLNEETISVIMWHKGGTPYLHYVKIEYSLDGIDGPWTTIIDSTSNPGFFFWQVPDVDGTQDNCFIRISDAGDGTLYDISDSAFTIRQSSIKNNIEKPQDLSLKISPNPFNSSCKIIVPADADVEIFDLRGNVVGATRWVTQQKGDATHRPYIWTPDKNISSGVYLVRAKTNNGNYIIKRIFYIE